MITITPNPNSDETLARSAEAVISNLNELLTQIQGQGLVSYVYVNGQPTIGNKHNPVRLMIEVVKPL